MLRSLNLPDVDQVVAECDYSGTMLRKFVYGPGIDEPLIMIVPAGQTIGLDRVLLG